MKKKSTSIVLAGLESSGKSALFRGLTGQASGDEANFRGSTVICRKCHVSDCGCDVVDTPGIRVGPDTETTRLALNATHEADVILMVARGTHAVSEVETLLRELDLHEKKTALAITFQDKAPEQIESLAQIYRERLGIPVVVINARHLNPDARQTVLQAIRGAKTTPSAPALRLPELNTPVVQPGTTWFEHRLFGPWLALVSMLLLFATPIYAAYLMAVTLQPWVDERGITPLKESLGGLPPLLSTLLTGGYGLLTLGWYSFLWAFPVVMLISVSVAVTEETGLKDRITSALDPWLGRVGLSGRDLIPVLTGFGCNVVAVFQSRSCSSCTRKNCLSLISFGSACSYQIGASLSLFNAAGKPGLFLPYLASLMLVGALHTRLWHGKLSAEQTLPISERAFLQWPSLRAIGWRLRTTLKQFLGQAMPVFLIICVVAALLDHLGVLQRLSEGICPAMQLFHLPEAVAPGLVFSILRKDGLLALHSDGGALLGSLSLGQLLVVVWLGSTLTACLVTLWTIRREMGWTFAAQTAGRQALTSLLSAWLLSRIVT